MSKLKDLIIEKAGCRETLLHNYGAAADAAEEAAGAGGSGSLGKLNLKGRGGFAALVGSAASASATEKATESKKAVEQATALAAATQKNGCTELVVSKAQGLVLFCEEANLRAVLIAPPGDKAARAFRIAHPGLFVPAARGR